MLLGLQSVNASASEINFAAFATNPSAALPNLQCRVQQETDATDSNVDSTANFTTCVSPQVVHKP